MGGNKQRVAGGGHKQIAIGLYVAVADPGGRGFNPPPPGFLLFFLLVQ